MEINLVSEGLKFMVLGMVTVFLFLILLVFVLDWQAKLLKKFFPQKTPQKAPVSPSNPTTKDNKSLVAAITAAITEYKKS